MELSNQYRDQGLVTIGIHSSNRTDPVKAQAMLEEFDAEFVTGMDDARGTAGAYGVSGIPHAALVDVDGNIAYRGHPGSLTNEMIEQQLARVDLEALNGGPFGSLNAEDYPRQIERAVEDLQEDKISRGLRRLSDVAEDDDEELVVLAEELLVLAHGVADSQWEAIVADDEAGLFYDAKEALEQFIDDFEVFEEFAAEAEALLATYDEDAKRDGYRAGRDYYKAVEDADEYHQAGRDRRAISELEDFIEDYPESPYAALAEALAARYRR